MSKELTCPICDSIKIEPYQQKEKDKLPLTGVELVYDKTIHVCQECGEKGEFSGNVSEANHEKYMEALKTANTVSLELILKRLSNFSCSMAYIERTLELPQRTLSRWKTQGISASGMALMKTIYTYPWILKVADEDFDEQFSRQEVIRQAAEIIPSPDRVHYSSDPKRIRISMDWDQRTTETEIEGESMERITFGELDDESPDKEFEITSMEMDT